MNKRIIQTAKRLFAASMIFMLGMTPNALAEEVETTYYITSRGVELTETQYNNLISIFTENSINTMTQEQINIYKNDGDLINEQVVLKLDENNGSTADPFIAAGSYQHATSNVTLTQSKWYDIMASGYGYVIDFYDIIQDKYDNTPGLLIAHSFKELEGE